MNLKSLIPDPTRCGHSSRKRSIQEIVSSKSLVVCVEQLKWNVRSVPLFSLEFVDSKRMRTPGGGRPRTYKTRRVDIDQLVTRVRKSSSADWFSVEAQSLTEQWQRSPTRHCSATHNTTKGTMAPGDTRDRVRPFTTVFVSIDWTG